MGYAIFAFFILFVLIGSALLLVFYREALGQRLAGVLGARGAAPIPVPSKLRQASESLGIFGGSVRGVMAKSEKEASVVQKRLILAGFRREQHLNIFYAAKVAVPVLLCLAAVVTGAYHWSPFFVFILALFLGYLAPDYWLGHRIKVRGNDLRLGLPDTLDLLVVCLEAGLSLDQAVLRASDELRLGHPAIADELGLVMLEVRAGKPRMEAWKTLAERTDLDDIRLLVSILVQADQFGTGVSRTLRVHADTIRTRRKQRIEELAAKTAVKLVFPLVLFIFPSIFVVTVGPAAMQIGHLFETFNKK
jgi:tight adherence protein C